MIAGGFEFVREAEDGVAVRSRMAVVGLAAQFRRQADVYLLERLWRCHVVVPPSASRVSRTSPSA